VTDGSKPPIRLFALSGIEQAKIQPETFIREEDFSLQEYANRAFGVFQEPPEEIVWKFNPAAAPSAREYLFHPSQVMEAQADGSLIVRFRAGGLKGSGCRGDRAGGPREDVAGGDWGSPSGEAIEALKADACGSLLHPCSPQVGGRA
jgi:hypothetical protein